MAKSIPSCMACGKVGHSATVKGGAYHCPVSRLGWGDDVPTGEGRRCGRCGCANFTYGDTSRTGVRGYRCAECGGVKPERRAS